MPLIDPGHPAPSFQAQDQHETLHTLEGYRGRPVILYFYPKDDTPGCTDESCQFRDALPAFDSAQAVILGISPDDVQSHAAFAGKFKLTFPLLADTERADAEAPAICDAYGVWGEKSMYGRTYMGVIRTTYLIGPDGTVHRRWDRVSVPGHAQEVLAAAHDLLGLPPPPSASPPASRTRKKVAPKNATKKKAAKKKARKKAARRKASSRTAARKQSRRAPVSSRKKKAASSPTSRKKAARPRPRRGSSRQ